MQLRSCVSETTLANCYYYNNKKRNYKNGDVRAQGACEVDGVPCARATGAECCFKYTQWRNWQVTA